MTKKSQGLKRTERIKSKLMYQDVFKKGESLFAFPIKLIYCPIADAAHPFLFGVTIPKRIHKRAVTRNLLKRRVREAYRRQKPLPIEGHGQYALLYILVDHNISSYHAIEKAIKKLNRKLHSSLQED